MGNEQEEKTEVRRVMKGSQKVFHDLFKLEVALLKRNMSYNKASPIWEHVEHVHYFHTYDSNGRKMSESVAVCGHKHPVTVEEVKRKVNGETVIDLVATCGVVEGHSHKCTYIRSMEIAERKVSEKAAEMITQYEKVLSGKVPNNQ